jgi:hypothetical protein
MTNERRAELMRAMRGEPDDQAVLFINGWGAPEITCGEMRALLASAPSAPQPESEAERTVRSLATMLGWMNVPPRETLEAEIRALKARSTNDFYRDLLGKDQRDKLSKAEADIDRLKKELAEAKFAPLGDNHHNAAACPYCSPKLATQSSRAITDSLVESGLVKASERGLVDAIIGRMSKPSASQEEPTPTCKVRAVGKTDPPQDCDWPFCGCDPHADKVIAHLQECDMLREKVAQEEPTQANSAGLIERARGLLLSDQNTYDVPGWGVGWYLISREKMKALLEALSSSERPLTREAVEARERCWKCEGDGDDGNPLKLSLCNVCQGAVYLPPLAEASLPDREREAFEAGWRALPTGKSDGPKWCFDEDKAPVERIHEAYAEYRARLDGSPGHPSAASPDTCDDLCMIPEPVETEQEPTDEQLVQNGLRQIRLLHAWFNWRNTYKRVTDKRAKLAEDAFFAGVAAADRDKVSPAETKEERADLSEIVRSLKRKAEAQSSPETPKPRERCESRNPQDFRQQCEFAAGAHALHIFGEYAWQEETPHDA